MLGNLILLRMFMSNSKFIQQQTSIKKSDVALIRLDAPDFFFFLDLCLTADHVPLSSSHYFQMSVLFSLRDTTRCS